MPMKIRTIKTDFNGLLIIEPEFFQDDRGFFFESYSKRNFEENGLDLNFVQDNHSRSTQGVLRGLHYQNTEAPQFRLVRCTAGVIWDVVVDLRVGSPTLGHWFGIQLSADEKKQLLIPPEFAHGFCVLSPVAEVQYKCTNFHTPSAEKTLAWDDEEVGISWPVKNPILSDRDREMGTSFRDYVTKPDFSY